MDGLAALVTSAALTPNVYPYPIESIAVPCTVIGYPERIDFDNTFGRGSDRADVPLWVIVGKTGTADARDALSTLIADASSVKSALDGQHAFGAVRVTDASIQEIAVGGVTYMAVKFSCDVIS